MNAAKKPVAWLCILSTLLMGCFGTVLVKPEGDDKERVCSNEIEYVITKDGRGYQFVSPPTIVNGAIIGEGRLNRDKVSIHLSDAALIGEYSGNITYVVTKSGTKYTFENPPATVDRTINGEAIFEESMPMKVGIPLSDVREASISKFSPDERMWLVGIGAAVVVVGAVALALWSTRDFSGAL
jgi:hypothetical protein